MKKVKVKKPPKKMVYGNGGPIVLGSHSLTDGTRRERGVAPINYGDGGESSNPNLQKNLMAYAPGALQTVGGFVDTVSEDDDGTVNVGGKAMSGALRGAGTGMGIGAMFGPVGAGIGAGIGAIAGGIGAGIAGAKRNKEMVEQRKEEQVRERERADNYSRAVLSVYPTTGVKDATYYAAYGGKMKYGLGGPMLPTQQGVNPQGQEVPVQGGEVDPLAQGVQKVQGPSHEQGGVAIGAAEVEGDEVLQNTEEGVNVFSDRLEFSKGITFAQQAEKLGKTKGDIELKLNDADNTFASNTAKREIEKLDTELKQLFEAQEMMKQRMGLENPEGEAGYGDFLTNSMTSVLPYVDNVGNAILTAKTPKIPAPIYDQAQPLKTEFNINPQLEAVNRQQANLQRNLTSNSSNSGAVRNQMIASGAMAMGVRNDLYGQKENAETALINQDALNRQGVNSANIAKENEYNWNKMSRVDDIHQRLSQNMSNVAEDAQMQIAEDNLRRKDYLTLEIMKAKYKEAGVYNRNLEKVFADYDSGKITNEEFQAMLKREKTDEDLTPEELELKRTGMTSDGSKLNPDWKRKTGGSQKGKPIKQRDINQWILDEKRRELERDGLTRRSINRYMRQESKTIGKGIN